MQLPTFSLPATGNQIISNETLMGQRTILFLYPKDDTPGCTQEALEFSAAKPQFDAAGINLLGVSKDSIAKHDKFIAKHNLDIALLSDEAGSLIEDLGAWVEKSMYGKTYMGIERSTFVIDAKGTIIKEWRKVRVSGHVQAVLDFATQA